MSGENISRRRFLSTSAAGAAALGALSAPAMRTLAASPNERVSLAVIGINGRGGGHVRGISQISKEAHVAFLCDIDQGVREKRLASYKENTGETPELCEDFRRALDSKDVDGVIIATPNHWHMPIALAAVEAGKDCYVEKPMSHTFQEGRLLVDAARKHGRIIQHGTQTRSSPVFGQAKEVLDKGAIGEVRMAKAWNLQRLRPIEAKPDGEAPAGVNYDRWLGPAPKRAFNPNRFHKTWHQFLDYGNGDIGDDGPHDIDNARALLGVDTHPVRITAHGSRTQLGGEREFPDTLNVSFEYADGRVLLYEERVWTPYGEFGFDNGNAFYGTKGRMIFSRRGHFQCYLGKKEEKGPSLVKITARGESHLRDFLSSVRSRKPTRATAEEGHLTCALVHLGLAAVKLERTLHFDPKTETCKDDAEANRLLTKTYRQPWGLPS